MGNSTHGKPKEIHSFPGTIVFFIYLRKIVLPKTSVSLECYRCWSVKFLGSSKRERERERDHINNELGQEDFFLISIKFLMYAHWFFRVRINFSDTELRKLYADQSLNHGFDSRLGQSARSNPAGIESVRKWSTPCLTNDISATQRADSKDVGVSVKTNPTSRRKCKFPKTTDQHYTMHHHPSQALLFRG